MYARLSTYQGTPIPGSASMTRRADEVLEQIRGLAGFQGLYLFVDRATGKEVSLTLWQDEATMQASESQAAKIRQESAAREGQRVLTVERFEVGFQHVEP